MIEIDDISFREWECFKHLRWSRPKISITFLMSQTFRTLAGRNSHSICYQLVTRLSSHIVEMIEAENLDLVANCRNYCTKQKMLEEAFSALSGGPENSGPGRPVGSAQGPLSSISVCAPARGPEMMVTVPGAGAGGPADSTVTRTR